MEHDETEEGRRWLLQAKQDLDDARYNLEGERYHLAFFPKYYIPTRYPDSLPGGIPAEAFEKRDADRAIEIAEEVIKVIEKKIGIY